jgi:hypothetical protein
VARGRRSRSVSVASPVLSARRPLHGEGVRTNPVSDLTPAHRGCDREARPRSRRPRTDGHRAAAVPQIIDEDAPGALSGCRGKRVSVRCGRGEALRHSFRMRSRRVVVDRRIERGHQVQALAPGQLLARAPVVQPSAYGAASAPSRSRFPSDTLARIEIDNEHIGALVIDARVPRVQLDRADLTSPSRPARSSTQSRVPSPPSRFSIVSLCTVSGTGGSGPL